tara:strand:- start:12642 stop:13349 length:708 start_codon:yes stop_codon:yes gene_type:complete
MGWFDTFLGNTDPNKISSMMKNNPMLSKMEGAIDDFTDISSGYYQKGQEFFGNMFSQQAANQSYTIRNQAEEQAAKGGGPSGGIMQNAIGQIRNVGAKAMDSTKSSLFDMYNKGQDIAQKYTQMASGIYDNANSAAASQMSQNNANKGSFIQSAVGTVAGLIVSDMRLKENIVSIDSTFKGLPKYRFNYINDKSKTPYIGLMAQDVREKYPDMVEEHKGSLYVNYRGLQSKKDKD